MSGTETTANTSVLSIGQKAVAKWNSAHKNEGQGNACAIVALMQARETLSFHAETTDKDKNVDRCDFDLDAYLFQRSVKNEDGSRNNKMTDARTAAVLLKVFGVTPEQDSQNIRNKLRFACDVVKDLVVKGIRAQDVSISAAGNLEIPYVLMHNEPKADASERDIKTWNKMREGTEILDGKNGMSVAKLAQRIKPERVQGPDRTDGQKTVSDFKTSLAFVTSIVSRFNDPNAEVDVAPTKELEAEMFNLQSQLTAYFKAYPVQQSKDTRASK